MFYRTGPKQSIYFDLQRTKFKIRNGVQCCQTFVECMLLRNKLGCLDKSANSLPALSTLAHYVHSKATSLGSL